MTELYRVDFINITGGIDLLDKYEIQSIDKVVKLAIAKIARCDPLYSEREIKVRITDERTDEKHYYKGTRRKMDPPCQVIVKGKITVYQYITFTEEIDADEFI